jgi:hypothetical protein
MQGKNMKMEKKLILPIMALLCMTLVSAASATMPTRPEYEYGTFTVTACGIGRRLSAFVSGSGGGTYIAEWDGSKLSWLEIEFTSGTVRALWYTTKWSRGTLTLTGVSGSWSYCNGEISGGGDTWTITDAEWGTFTITWNSGHTSATICGRVYLPVDDIGTVTLCIKGTATPTSIVPISA